MGNWKNLNIKMTKYTHILITALLGLSFLVPASAQGYTPPSQELVTQLLSQINACKKEATALKEFLATDQGIDAFINYEAYKKSRYRLEEVEKCIAKNREELDTLRKNYPGWFNGSSTIILPDRNEIIARELEQKVEELNPFEAFIEAIHTKYKDHD